jgi:type IV pilus assembly protein PilA
VVAALFAYQANSFEGAFMTTQSRTARSAAMPNRRGFTLIELLIVVVIIGLLAAIAIPKFGNTKGKAVVASLRSDLRNLATAQEAYWNEQRTYYAGIIPDPTFQYQPTLGNTITIVNASDAGWSAKATAPTTAQQCVIFYGTTPPIPPATADAAVACT